MIPDHILPLRWAIYVLQVDSLPILVSATIRCLKELIRKLAHVPQIVANCQWQILLGGEVPCILYLVTMIVSQPFLGEYPRIQSLIKAIDDEGLAANYDV